MAVKLEGPLTKWTNVVQGWQYRWFVLDDNAGLLSYYTSKEKMVRGARRGCLRLKGAQTGISDEDDSTFTLTCDHRTFHFQAHDKDERIKWVQSLEATIKKLANSQSVGNTNDASIEEELNGKLLEAEAYFRILTQQIKKLELQIDHSVNAKCERSLLFKDSLTQMIETIGQAIELLRAAKLSLVRKVPIPVIVGSVVNDSDIKSKLKQIKSSIETTSELPSVSQQFEKDIEVGCELTEIGLEYINIPSAEFLTPTIPIDTYTLSSDEEGCDEFFDAADEFTNISTFENNLLNNVSDLVKSSAAKQLVSSAIENNRVKEKKTMDEEDYFCQDDEFEEDKDSDVDEKDEDMQSHGSVITHLLSQVKIGMDLTKVTLPTFILERRSLLEMYADFFAHPDLFKEIPDIKDPGDRMIQVLKWYLSSFHAGRKGSVAKKPYNPILGEIFQCFYKCRENHVAPSQDNLASSGPIPWATKDDVTFLAEQVSHHPPISAFYAECENKRICFNSQIWTKSKFLGLSIGVHMMGSGSVFVSDHDEEYIMTFPNAYGRSILTVPWVELGGRTEITCAKSGYSSQIELHTKPFYGGKRNRITAEVFAPNQKKPILSVSGEWNGIMYAKFADDKEATPFVDTLKMPVTKKIVKKIDKQEEFESRRMWCDVTKCLKINDIDNATNNKLRLEDKQRMDARVRKETDSKWITRVFDEWEEGEERKWFYKWPLYKRHGLPKPGCT